MDYAKAYGEIHQLGKRFPGFAIHRYVGSIAEQVRSHQPGRLLDYGCGKGYQYLARRCHEQWGGLLPYCYDIGVQQLSERPKGQFGGVINTDMLEHIERQDVPRILADLIGYVEKGGFLFLGIACRPSHKKLPDRRSVHVTVERPGWWIGQIEKAMDRSGRRGEFTLVAEFDHGDPAHFADDASVSRWQMIP